MSLLRLCAIYPSCIPHTLAEGGTMPGSRTSSTITPCMSDAHVMSSHTKTMINHLISCQLQPEDIRQQAEVQKAKYSDRGKSPVRQHNMHISQRNSPEPQLPFPGPSLPSPSFSSGNTSYISLDFPEPNTSEMPPIDPQLRYQPYPLPIFTYSHSGTPSASSSLDSLHPSESHLRYPTNLHILGHLLGSVVSDETHTFKLMFLANWLYQYALLHV